MSMGSMNIDDMPAGAEINALVAEKVMGLKRGVKPHRTDAGTLTTKWRASITRGRRTINLGLYEAREGAVRARLVAEQEIRSAIGI